MLKEVYSVVADEKELKWFFDHVIQRPQVNESYSAVFVCRHKKLTKEEQETLGLTRKEGEFLATQTFRLKNIKEGKNANDPDLWTFDNFLKRLKRFEVNKEAYTTSTGEPLPDRCLATIFYVNPGDDMKVCRAFVDEYMEVTEAISKAMLNGKTTADNYQSYQWFGNAESTIKHFKANKKGSRFLMDFDIDVPAWFKNTKDQDVYAPPKVTHFITGYYKQMINYLNEDFGKGNYVIIDTSGGYHVLVKTSAIKSNPHDFCKNVSELYNIAVSAYGEEPYLDEKGNCKFECIVNDSQIPGLPLPGTYQYDRPVTVLNKEDFE